MSKIDLIIDAIELARMETQHPSLCIDKFDEALAAARELQALKPVGYMDKNGILFNDTTHPHLYTALYALDEVTK